MLIPLLRNGKYIVFNMIKDWLRLIDFGLLDIAIKSSKVLRGLFVENCVGLKYTTYCVEDLLLTFDLLVWLDGNHVQMPETVNFNNTTLSEFGKRFKGHQYPEGFFFIKHVKVARISPENAVILLSLLCNATNLESLAIRGSQYVDSDFIERLTTYCTHLRTVMITGNKEGHEISDEPVTILFKKCKLMNHLETFTDRNTSSYADRVTTLEYFNEKLYKIYTTISCAQIMTLCFGYTHLTVLHTTEPLSHFAIKHIISEYCPNLKTFHFSMNETVKDGTLYHLAKSCSDLSDVSLKFNYDTEITNSGITNFLKLLHGLTALIFDNYTHQYNNECTNFIFKNCAKTLHILCIRNIYGDQPGFALGSLQDCKNLTTLVLTGVVPKYQSSDVDNFQLLIQYGRLAEIGLVGYHVSSFIDALVKEKKVNPTKQLALKIISLRGDKTANGDKIDNMFDCIDLNALTQVSMTQFNFTDTNQQTSKNVLIKLQFASNLRHCKLAFCQFVRHEHVVLVAKHCRKLITFSYGSSNQHNSLSDETLFYVVQNLPKLLVLMMYRKGDKLPVLSYLKETIEEINAELKLTCVLFDDN